MIYSVWNQATRRYDYYKAPSSTATHAGKPAHLSGLAAAVTDQRMGSTPEDAAWPLPPGAQKVGAGDRAIGQVATLGGWGFMALPGWVVAMLIATTFWYLGRRNR